MSIVKYVDIKKMLFFDIETVSEKSDYEELDEETRELWDNTSKRYLGENYLDKTLEEKKACYKRWSAIYPEFSKIVCIGYGLIRVEENPTDPDNSERYLNSLHGNDEAKLLKGFLTILVQAFDKNPERILCGHNIAGFDIPFIIKRMLKHKISVPKILTNLFDVKPWEQRIVDSIRVWKFGGTEFVSLALICNHLGIPSPKTGEVSGKNLNEFYWFSEDPEKMIKISKYCIADVDTVISLMMYLAKYS